MTKNNNILTINKNSLIIKNNQNKMTLINHKNLLIPIIKVDKIMYIDY